MKIVFGILLVANVFFVVYYRLLIHYFRHAPGGEPHAGFGTVISLPEKKRLAGVGMKYWRRYWIAIATMVALIAAGLAWRYPYVSASFRMMDWVHRCSPRNGNIRALVNRMMWT